MNIEAEYAVYILKELPSTYQIEVSFGVKGGEQNSQKIVVNIKAR